MILDIERLDEIALRSTPTREFSAHPAGQLLVDFDHPEGGRGDTGVEGVLLDLEEYDLDLYDDEAVRGLLDAT